MPLTQMAGKPYIECKDNEKCYKEDICRLALMNG